jgi:F-type H+-transporting ATPase subunit delta
MMERGVALRYATALFNSALKQGLVDDVHEETATLKKVLEDNTTFSNFLISPQIRTENKQELIDATLKGKASDLFVRFLHLLVEKKRILYIKDIADEYHQLYEEHKGILEARVITAIPLDETMERKVIDKLKAETQKDVRIVSSVEPGIIGGMIIHLEDKIIDGSIRFRLETLRRELDEVRV